MRKLFFTLLLTPLFTFAQDDKATAILNEVSAKTASYRTIEARFTNSIISKAAGINENQDGVLYLEGDFYRIEMDEQSIISDGETNWIFLHDEQEVQITEIDEDDEEQISPSKMFTLYQEGYKYKYKKESAEQHIIDLYPEVDNSFKKIELRINKKELHVAGFTLFDKNGNEYDYTVTFFNPNEEMPPNYFQFDASKHPEVDIIDLR
jgi:outer membrane lipoprotein-sorting protein